MAMTRPVQVLVVDDSAFMRKVLTGILEGDPEISIVGTARDGMEAVEKAVALRPDVITLDVEMPRLDGLAALKEIMQKAPCPVLMVSSLTQSGAQTTIRALNAGAVDFITKPSGAISLDLYRVTEELRAKVKQAARVPRTLLRTSARDIRPLPQVSAATAFSATQKPWLTILAASTGGPSVLHHILSMLPTGLHSSFLIVQHMPVGFTAPLAEHLNKVAQMEVKEAASGMRLEKGAVFLAPGGKHLVLTAGETLELDDGPTRHGVRPAADVTLESVSERLAARTIVVILTGMGSDGAAGARQLRERGAQIWAQDEASCVVFGMPKAALQVGAVDRIGTPEQIATWLTEFLGGGQRS